LPSFEEVKDQLLASLIQNKLKTVVQDLRSTAKVEIVDPELKKAIEEDAKAAAADAPAEPKQ
jgi:peptidyl-prolyl cis-trans isomerase C